MKAKYIFLLASILALPVYAQDDRNVVRVVTAPECAHACADVPGCASLDVCGTHKIQLVVVNPWNEATQSPVTTISGFEGKLVLPPEVPILGVELTYEMFNYADPPNLQIGGWQHVVGGSIVVATITVELPESWDRLDHAYLEPIDGQPAIGGSLAVTDRNDSHAPVAVTPCDGLENPVLELGINEQGGQVGGCLVPAGDPSWSTLKALFR